MAASTTATTSAASHAGSLERRPGRVDVEDADARAATRRPGCGRARGRRRSPSAHGPLARSRPGRAPPRPTAGRRQGAPPGRSAAIEPPPAPMVWIAERRQAHRVAADHQRRRRIGHAALDQAHVGGRAAHVEADGAREAVGHRDRRGGPHPGRRARTAGARPVARRRRPGRRARRPTSSRAPPAPVPARPLQVGAAGRAEVGVHHGRDRPLVLPELGRHLVGARHVVAQARAACAATASSWPAVEVGVQQAHRDGLGLDRRQPGRRRRPRARQPSAASRPRHAVAARARHERRAAGRPTGRTARAGPGGRSRSRPRSRRWSPAPPRPPAARGGRWSPPWCRGPAARRRQRARCRRPPRRPGRPACDGTFTTSPSSVTTSVKVPPVSTPTRMTRRR